MKKMFVVFLAVLLLCGCSAPKESEQAEQTEPVTTTPDESTAATSEDLLDETGIWGTPPKVFSNIEGSDRR